MILSWACDRVELLWILGGLWDLEIFSIIGLDPAPEHRV